MSRAELVEVVLRGGYPIAVGLPPDARQRWFSNLATLVIERISDDVTVVRNPGTLSQFLRLADAGTAQLRNAAEIGREVGLGRDQSGAYLRLLELAYLTHRAPAWAPSLSSRMTKRPKLHLVDSGLAAHLLGVTAQHLVRWPV